MRIGVRVASDRLVGAFVDQGGEFGSHAIALDGYSLSTALVRLMDALIEPSKESSRTGSGAISSIVFDVSDVLAPQFETPTTLVRIAPRPPADSDHELRSAPELGHVLNILHVAGGHTTLGDELVRLDADAMRRWAVAAPRGARYIITSVGSLVNAAHERRAGEILLDHAEPSSIAYSHPFPASSFAVREHSALANALLVPGAAALGTALALAAGAYGAQDRLYVTTNDGGVTPLARLALTPLHSVRSASPIELIGAAALCGLDDGRVIVADGDSAFLGELVEGAPTVVPQRARAAAPVLATQAANILPVTESHLSSRNEQPTLVARGPASDATLRLGMPISIQTDVDLRALGAACAPLSDWVNDVVNVGNATEMEQALASAKARVGARLVSFGAAPSQVKILEAQAVATTYENPRVVSVRVRGVAREIPVGLTLTSAA